MALVWKKLPFFSSSVIKNPESNPKSTRIRGDVDCIPDTILVDAS
jgi:hypothetical protein